VEGCPWWNWWPLFQSLWRTLAKGALGAWCNVIDCFSGSYKMVMHLST